MEEESRGWSKVRRTRGNEAVTVMDTGRWRKDKEGDTKEKENTDKKLWHRKLCFQQFPALDKLDPFHQKKMDWVRKL